MKRIVIIVISALLIPVFASGKDAPKQLSVDNIQVLKIAAQDERAVIRTPDGKTRIIKVGDVIESGQLSAVSGKKRGEQPRAWKVIEIAKNRVVFEEKNEKETEKVIVRLVDGKQKVERVRRSTQPSAVSGQRADNKE